MSNHVVRLRPKNRRVNYMSVCVQHGACRASDICLTVVVKQ